MISRLRARALSSLSAVLLLRVPGEERGLRRPRWPQVVALARPDRGPRPVHVHLQLAPVAGSLPRGRLVAEHVVHPGLVEDAPRCHAEVVLSGHGHTSRVLGEPERPADLVPSLLEGGFAHVGQIGWGPREGGLCLRQGREVAARVQEAHDHVGLAADARHLPDLLEAAVVDESVREEEQLLAAAHPRQAEDRAFQGRQDGEGSGSALRVALGGAGLHRVGAGIDAVGEAAGRAHPAPHDPAQVSRELGGGGVGPHHQALVVRDLVGLVVRHVVVPELGELPARRALEQEGQIFASLREPDAPPERTAGRGQGHLVSRAEAAL